MCHFVYNGVENNLIPHLWVDFYIGLPVFGVKTKPIALPVRSCVGLFKSDGVFDAVLIFEF